MDTDWWLFGATLFAGVGTLALAWFAYRAIRENRGLITANTNQVEALQQQTTQLSMQAAALRDHSRHLAEQAAAVSDQVRATRDMAAEMVRDREQFVRPYLVAQLTFFQDRGGIYNRQQPVLRVDNIGSGPAINCRAASRQEVGANRPSNKSTGLFSLGSGMSVQLDYDSQGHWHDTLLVGVPESPLPIMVCVCEDQLGNRYRFVSGVPTPEIHARDYAEAAGSWSPWHTGPLMGT
jgi:hypothetical protein